MPSVSTGCFVSDNMGSLEHRHLRLYFRNFIQGSLSLLLPSREEMSCALLFLKAPCSDGRLESRNIALD
jgi:hypothetical protein